MLFNITYVYSMEHRAVRLLSRRYDLTDYATSIWKLESTLVHRDLCGDRPGRSSWTRIAISRNVEEPLRAAMEYLQDVTKRI